MDHNKSEDTTCDYSNWSCKSTYAIVTISKKKKRILKEEDHK